ncbi:MAG TPA: universal stress protein [Dyella sp.]|uniref:universal stress protein n=1 Tax=Dyella sp. TaxID=1869338 RepID=UPI002F92BA72
MFRDIAVPMTGGSYDDYALQAALSLSAHYQAKLAALEIVELPMPAYDTWALTPDPGTMDLYDTLRKSAEERSARLRQRLAKEKVVHRIRTVEALYISAWDAAAREAVYADLIVVPGFSRKEEKRTAHANGVASLLIEAGRPILVIPEQASLVFPLNKVVLAWRSSKEASRALHDAIPLLRDAKSVDVLIYDEDQGAPGKERQNNLIGHLAAHDVNAKAIVRKSRGIDIGSLILSHAEKVDADLVVAGGYGHSRFREWALGGVTRELLRSSRIPLLLSH